MKKIAFIFPGQGAQYVGMGEELYENFGAAKQVFDAASSAIGYDIAKMCFEGPEDDLKVTEVTQPTILTVSLAAMEVLKSEGIHPEAAAGLSLGEYGALVAASCMKIQDVIPLVRKRGRFMQEAVPVGEGTMAAIIGLEKGKVLECCREASDCGVVEGANFNCPGQIVISGHVAAVEKACKLCKDAGAKRALILPVSAPFHSSLLKPAGERLEEELKHITVSKPRIPVVANVTADLVEQPENIKELLVQQVSHPVLWEDCILKLLSMGYDTFIEVGPGKALSGFMKKIDKSAGIYNVEDLASLDNTIKAVRSV